MTSQGEIGEMSCAEAIGGFASLSGSRGMLLAGASDSRSQDRWILCADSIQRHVLLCGEASKKKNPSSHHPRTKNVGDVVVAGEMGSYM